MRPPPRRSRIPVSDRALGRNQPPDLILLDLQMPDVTGLGHGLACQAARSRVAGSGTARDWDTTAEARRRARAVTRVRSRSASTPIRSFCLVAPARERLGAADRTGGLAPAAVRPTLTCADAHAPIAIVMPINHTPQITRPRSTGFVLLSARRGSTSRRIRVTWAPEVRRLVPWHLESDRAHERRAAAAVFGITVLPTAHAPSGIADRDPRTSAQAGARRCPRRLTTEADGLLARRSSVP